MRIRGHCFNNQRKKYNPFILVTFSLLTKVNICSSPRESGRHSGTEQPNFPKQSHLMQQRMPAHDSQSVFLMETEYPIVAHPARDQPPRLKNDFHVNHNYK